MYGFIRNIISVTLSYLELCSFSNELCLGIHCIIWFTTNTVGYYSTAGQRSAIGRAPDS